MIELSLYAQRWIALNENGEVVGVGQTPEAAQHAGQALRPKEHLELAWVSPFPPHLPLPEWPLQRLRPLIPLDRVWIVGGSVRDMLLNRPVHDWDFVVAGPALALTREVANALHGAFVVLDEERDTGRVVLTNPRTHAPITLDFATLRGLTLNDDLFLRDFTINAMALTFEGALSDPAGGQNDLSARQLRMTSPRSFQDDPGRLLRAVRQAGALNFEIESQTAAAIQNEAVQLKQAATERLLAELLRIVQLDSAGPSLQTCARLGLLGQLLPEVVALRSTHQSEPHIYADAWRHTLAALAAMETLLQLIRGRPLHLTGVPGPTWAWNQLQMMLAPHQTALAAYLYEPLAVEMPRLDLLKWGVLFHDIGKAGTATQDEETGRTHFYGHADLGAGQTLDRLVALRFPRRAAEFVAALVRHHMRPIDLAAHTPTRRTIYRFYRDTESAGVGVLLLALADALGVWGKTLNPTYWQKFLHAINILISAYFEQQDEVIMPPPLLNGHELLARGCPPGPRVGQLLEALREAQAAGEITDRAAAEALIQKLLTAE